MEAVGWQACSRNRGRGVSDYPFIAWERDGVECIACGPRRVRLLWGGRYVATFTSSIFATAYAEAELLFAENRAG